MNLRTTLGHYFKLTSGRAFASFLQLVMVGLIARAVSAHDFGVFTVSLAWGTFAGLAVDLGLSQLVVRELAAQSGDPRRLFQAGLYVRLGLAPVILLGIGTISWIAYGRSMVLPVLLGSTAFMLRLLAEYASAAMVALQRITAGIVAQLAPNVLVLILLGILLLAGVRSVPLLLLSYVLGTLAVTVACQYAVLSRLQPASPEQPLALRRFLAAAGAFLALPFASLICFPGDGILVSFFKPTAEVGFYQAAQRILLGFEGPGLALAVITLPQLSRAFRRSLSDLQAAAATYLRWVLLAAIPVAFLLSTLARSVIRIAYGPRLAPAVPILQVMALLAMLRLINIILSNSLTAMGRQALVTRASLLIAAVQIAAACLLLPARSIETMAWIVVSVTLLLTLQMWVALRGAHVAFLDRSLLLGGAAATAAMIAGHLLLRAYSQVLAAVVGVAAYAAVLWLTGTLDYRALLHPSSAPEAEAAALTPAESVSTPTQLS